MEQKDTLLKQIELLGRVLGKAVSQIIEIKSGNIHLVVENTQQTLQAELNLDLEKLMRLKENDLQAYLTSLNFNTAHLEKLSEYLEAVAKTKTKTTETHIFLQKAITLLDTADAVSASMSFTRISRKQKLQKQLNSQYFFYYFCEV